MRPARLRLQFWLGLWLVSPSAFGAGLSAELSVPGSALGPSESVRGGVSVAFNGTDAVASWVECGGPQCVVRGARYSNAGVPRDAVSLVLGTTPGPTTAIGCGIGTGTCLVAYPQGGALRGVRLAGNGAVLDAAPLRLASAFVLRLAAAHDGSAWYVATIEGASVKLYEVATNGQVTPAASSAGGIGIGSAGVDIACRANQCLVVWAERVASSIIRGQLFVGVTPSGPLLAIGTTASNVYTPRVATDGAGYLVSWVDNAATTSVRARAVSATGGVTGNASGTALASPVNSSTTSHLAWNGASWSASWTAVDGSPVFSRFATSLQPLDGTGISASPGPQPLGAEVALAGLGGGSTFTFASWGALGEGNAGVQSAAGSWAATAAQPTSGRAQLIGRTTFSGNRAFVSLHQRDDLGNGGAWFTELSTRAVGPPLLVAPNRTRTERPTLGCGPSVCLMAVVDQPDGGGRQLTVQTGYLDGGPGAVSWSSTPLAGAGGPPGVAFIGDGFVVAWNQGTNWVARLFQADGMLSTAPALTIGTDNDGTDEIELIPAGPMALATYYHSGLPQTAAVRITSAGADPPRWTPGSIDNGGRGPPVAWLGTAYALAECSPSDTGQLFVLALDGGVVTSWALPDQCLDRALAASDSELLYAAVQYTDGGASIVANRYAFDGTLLEPPFVIAQAPAMWRVQAVAAPSGDYFVSYDRYDPAVGDFRWAGRWVGALSGLPGSSCAGAAQCSSGVCIAGVCCSTACGTDCSSGLCGIGAPPIDAGTPPVDAGAPPPDAGASFDAGGTVSPDGGWGPSPDGGMWSGSLADGGFAEPIISGEAPASATCGQLWSWAPQVTGDPPLVLELRSPPEGLVLGDAGLTWRPTKAQLGAQFFALAAGNPGATTIAVVRVDVECPGKTLTVGCGCGTAGPMLVVPLVVLWLRRRRQAGA